MAVTPRDVALRYGVGEKWVRQVSREEIAGHGRHARWVWQDWDDAELGRVLRRLENGDAVEGPKEWDAVISGKNQLTLPAAALRALRLKSGHRVCLSLKENALEIVPSPTSWVDHYAGIADGIYGRKQQELDTYVRESRGDWEETDTGESASESQHRWGEKSVLVERYLEEQAVHLSDEHGESHSLVPNFSSIARHFGVTREHVRQIADSLGIESYHRAQKSIKRQIPQKRP